MPVEIRIDGAMWCANCRRPLNEKAVKADVTAVLARITAEFARTQQPPEPKA